MLTEFEKKHILESYYKRIFIKNPFVNQEIQKEKTIATHKDFLNWLNEHYNISKKENI